MAIIYAIGFTALSCTLFAAPPEITGAGGDGRIDITSMAQPPWWAHVELLTIIGILFALVVVVAIWNRSLNLLAHRRAFRLAQEEIAHARTKLKVEERTELAVEIHDAVSQALTGIALQLEAARSTASKDSDRSAHFLSIASQMLASCQHELRCCLWDLRTRTFEEQDLTEALSHALAPHLEHIKTQICFNIPREQLSESTTHDIIKIVRELTVNAVQHGRAKHIRIAGETHDGVVRFSVTDDGSGFNTHTIPSPQDGHFGLQGVRERLRKYGGSMKITSGPCGTKVRASMKADICKENL